MLYVVLANVADDLGRAQKPVGWEFRCTAQNSSGWWHISHEDA